MTENTPISDCKSIQLVQKKNFRDDTLSEKTQKIIQKIPNKTLTFDELITVLGSDGLLLFAALLTIIFLIPVSIPGLSAAFGIIIFFIAFSRLMGIKLWLPQSIKTKTLSADKLRTSLNKGLKWVHWLEKISKPHRLQVLTCSRMASTLNNILILISCLLMMLPFGVIPFSNTLPAVAILFLIIGTLQKDGLIIILGYIALLASFVYFGLFFTTIVAASKQVINGISA